MLKCNITFINSSKELNLFQNAILTSPVIALDTEFTRKSTYNANLSILQICVNTESVFIVDYLQQPDIVLKVLDIIYSSKAIKVFHAAKNDLEIFYKLTNKLPNNIFDTQVAFLALSPLNNVSYAYLIKETLNIQLDKTETLSDWSKRPFSDKQIIYAAQDVSMLFKAYYILYNKLKELNRVDYIREKLNSLVDTSKYTFNIDKTVKRYIYKYNINKNYSLLAAIINYREYTAQNINIPKKYILDDITLKNLVANPKLGSTIFKNSKYINMKVWKDIVETSNTHFAYFSNLKIEKPFPTHSLLSLCLKLLEYTSVKESINKDLICTKSELNRYLNCTNFTTKTTILEKDKDPFYTKWRYNLFTKNLERFLTGKIHLSISNGSINFSDC